MSKEELSKEEIQMPAENWENFPTPEKEEAYKRIMDAVNRIRQAIYSVSAIENPSELWRALRQSRPIIDALEAIQNGHNKLIDIASQLKVSNHKEE